MTRSLTPQYARSLLFRQPEPNSQEKADEYADMMTSGEWGTTPSLMIVDEDGRLLDGFHRCWAVALSGVGIAVTVATTTREQP